MTALSTAKSGYIQRKIAKVCEDIQIQYDQTVRDATGKIYQFAYGNDCFDPVKTIRVKNMPPQACDIERLVGKLNTSHELGLKEKVRVLEPETKSEFITRNVEVKDEDKEDKEPEEEGDEEGDKEEGDEEGDKEEGEDDFLEDEEIEEPENDFEDTFSVADD